MSLDTALNDVKERASLTTGKQPIRVYFAYKKWPTRAVGAILLVLASPVILLLIGLVRCTSRGPGLYSQVRTGCHGSEFKIYKIRTMYADAESVSGPSWCMPGDSRITPVGRVLRLMHLDELPQLINVARGEMDLIGPRPERPPFVSWLAEEIPNYRDRLIVLPGVTGLAQINLPPDESVDSVRKKLVLDCHYIKTATFGMDLRILLCTFLRMVGIRHGRAPRWLGLTYEIADSNAMNEEAEDLPYQWLTPTNEQVEPQLVVAMDDSRDLFDIPVAVTSSNDRSNKQKESLAGSGARRRRPK